MRPKSFNHFILAGVIAMTSAGLVTVNGSSLARTIRLADLSQMRTPASVNGGEMRGTNAAQEFAPQYPLMPQNNDPHNRQEPSMQVRTPQYQNRDVPAVQRQGTAGGSAMPQSLGMDFLKKMMLPPGQKPVMHTAPQMNEQNTDQQKMMRMKEEMLRKSAGQESDTAPSQSAVGEGAVQNPAVEKDMMQQLGVKSDLVRDIRQQLQQDDNGMEQDACSMVDMVLAERIDQLEEKSAMRIAMYEANKAKTKSAAVQAIWQKRIDNEPTKLAEQQEKLEKKADALRDKYRCSEAADVGG